MPEGPFLSRQARFARIGSTNNVIRDWLADGTPEVCLAVADEQTAGRGRAGRSWQAPPGAALLLSLGFRPTWLPADKVWRLAVLVSLAMADAAEEVAGLPDGTVRLKWPNDLVVEAGTAATAAHEESAGETLEGASPGPSEGSAQDGSGVLKLGGVLGESEGLGTSDPRVVVGIGVNAGWRAPDFPRDLSAAMTSLHEASQGRPVDLPLLLDAFLGRLEVRIAALRAGRFDLADWNARQITTGRDVEIEWPDGSSDAHRAVGLDASSGGLVVDSEEGEHVLVSGEVRRVRVPARSTAVGVTP